MKDEIARGIADALGKIAEEMEYASADNAETIAAVIKAMVKGLSDIKPEVTVPVSVLPSEVTIVPQQTWDRLRIAVEYGKDNRISVLEVTRVDQSTTLLRS